MERQTIDGNSPVFEIYENGGSVPEYRETRKFCGKLPGPSGKAKYSKSPIVNKYREGKVKRTPRGEWNRYWNHVPTSRQSTLAVWCRAYWRMSLRVNIISKLKLLRSGGEGKPNRVNSAYKLITLDPKPSELTMGRVKFREIEMEARTRLFRKILGWPVVSGEMLIELGDSWLSPKYI